MIGSAAFFEPLAAHRAQQADAAADAQTIHGSLQRGPSRRFGAAVARLLPRRLHDAGQAGQILDRGPELQSLVGGDQRFDPLL